jgi:hypothetical protein
MVSLPPRDHRISLETGETMTARYRKTMGPLDIRGGWFPAAVFRELLAQRRAAGIRIYVGRHDDGMMNFVLVATDLDGNDILPLALGVPRAKNADDEEGILMENSYPCPIYCGGGDGLNGEG